MAKDPKEISKTFCVMPWTNLATETNGKCKICCVVVANRYIKRDDGSDFEIQSDSIEDIWNSNYIRDVRKKMLAGEWATDCLYCQGREAKAQLSPRQSYNETWYEESVEPKVKNSQVDNGQVLAMPTSLELRPGILCNLKCNMCWSMSSSKILAERKYAIGVKSHDIPQFIKEDWISEIKLASESDFAWSEKNVYLKNLEKCLPTLKRLYLTGGEPTLIKSNLTMLKQMIEMGNTDLLVSFTTNLQVLPQEWLDILPQFSKIEITGSIDGYGSATEYIRYPSSWIKVSENLEKLYHLYPKISFSVNYVVQVANIFSYVNFVKWIANKFPNRQIQVMTTILMGPEYLRPEILDAETRAKAIAYIEAALNDGSILERNKVFMRDVQAQIKIEHVNAVDTRKQFRDYIAYLDKSRKTNFRKTFPEMTDFINGES